MFYALGFVPLATAAAISFTAPLIVTALAPFALGERVGAARAIAVGVGFLGAMVVVRPGSGAYHWAVFLIFISAAASAVTQVLSRKVAGHDAPETSNTYMVLAGFIWPACRWPSCGTRLQVGRMRWWAPSTWGGAWRGRPGRVGDEHDIRSQVTLRRLSLSGRSHQPRRLAVLPLSAQPAHGRRDAGGPRPRREP